MRSYSTLIAAALTTRLPVIGRNTASIAYIAITASSCFALNATDQRSRSAATSSVVVAGCCTPPQAARSTSRGRIR